MSFNFRATKAFLLLAAVVFGAASCSKKDDAPVKPYGKLDVSFSNEVDGKPVVIGPMSYTNDAGNQYSVSLLKYYVSNFTLIRADGSGKNFHNYKLIDASDSSTSAFSLDSVDNGAYTAVRFYIGVDEDRNHTGVQDGDLDAAKGMIWTWNTGYIFFKHEGAFKDSNGVNTTLALHFGTDKALTTVTVPITGLEIRGDSRKLSLKFDLNKLYADPNRIDFNIDHNRQSTAAADAFWIMSMKYNFPAAFLFDKVQ